jgi:hypothetical protein
MLGSIIWLLTWPLLIYVSYWAVKKLLVKYGSKLDGE